MELAAELIRQATAGDGAAMAAPGIDVVVPRATKASGTETPDAIAPGRAGLRAVADHVGWAVQRHVGRRVSYTSIRPTSPAATVRTSPTVPDVRIAITHAGIGQERGRNPATRGERDDGAATGEAKAAA